MLKSQIRSDAHHFNIVSFITFSLFQPLNVMAWNIYRPSDRWWITACSHLTWIALLVNWGWPCDIYDLPLIIRSFNGEPSIRPHYSINPCLNCELSVCCLILNLIISVTAHHAAISIVRWTSIFVLFCRRCHIFLLFTHLHLRQSQCEALYTIVIVVAI